MAENWPDEIDLPVTGIAQGGDGVGRWEGRAVFASGALPGERVRVWLHERQRSFARGRTVEVYQAAPERTASPCPFEDRRGAADWRWIAYDAQLRFKATILKDQMRHIGGLDIKVAAIHGMPSTESHNKMSDTAGPGWGYRTTVELHVAGNAIGYYAPNSRRVAHIPQCCLHHPLIDEALAALHQIFDGGMRLRGVTLRCAPASRTVLAVLDGDRPPHQLAEQWMAACPQLVGVLHRTHSGMRTIRGQDHLIHEIGGLRWHLGAASFFQVNDRQTGTLIERVQELMAVSRDKRLLDLFCGVGTFALPLAKAGGRLTGVEVYAPAIEDAQRSADLNGLSGIEWHVGPVERILRTFTAPFDGVVLDPPRRGCEPDALQVLLRLRPPRIVYVACHPGTLARDCKILSEGGYRVERAEVIDLFPQTHHVESIVLLRRSG